MQVNLNIYEKVANELFVIFKSEDINAIINRLLADVVSNPKKQIEDFFNKVDYFDDYDYKLLSQRDECIS